MKYLTRPRGKGYSLRMATPDALVGLTNPMTGKPFGREIKLGLDTRVHAEAIRIRDIKLGQIRQLEQKVIEARRNAKFGRQFDLSLENAKLWQEILADGAPWEVESIRHDELERAQQAGRDKEVRKFSDVVYTGAVPLHEALEEYLEERSEGNPFGLEPLSKTTALNVRSSVKHLNSFLGDETPTRGVLPFMISDLLRLSILVIFRRYRSIYRTPCRLFPRYEIERFPCRVSQCP